MMLYRLFLIIVLSVFAGGALSAFPVVHFGPTPAWVVPAKGNVQQPNLREVNDGYYLRLFEQEANVESEEYYQHIVKEIVSDAGVQAASNLSIDFNPAYEQLTVHQIVVWRDGVRLERMQKNAFKIIANEEELSKFLYNGNYTAYLILEDIRKGDKIEYSYTLKGSNPIFEKKFTINYYFSGTDPISELHYCIVAPSSRTLNFKYYNDAAQPVTAAVNGNTKYEWDIQNVKGTDYGSNIPKWFNPLPHVQVSEYKSWDEIVNWAYKINMPQDKLGGELGKRMAQLKEEYKNDQEKLFRAIVDIVQNEVRYMGVEIGPYSHKANAPEKVYNQRYGDCKDKSLLLVSMLRNAGIMAEMALVNTKDGKALWDQLPTPYAFNHAVVVAHLQGAEIWIDPTVAYQGGKGGSLYFSNYGPALVLSPNTTALKVIPETASGKISYTETYDVTDEHSAVTMTVRTVYTGSHADDVRGSYANQSKSDLEKNFLEYYSKLYSHIESLDTLVIKDNRSENIFETIERYTIQDFFEYDSVNRNYSSSFYASMIKNLLPVVDKKNNYPLATNYPYNVSYRILVNAPITWQIQHAKEEISRNAYSFLYDISSEGNTLKIMYDFSYFKDHIAANEVAQYEKDYKKIVNEYLSYAFTYTPASTIAATYGGVNYLAILVFAAVLGGCAYASVRIYKTRTERTEHYMHEPRVLGGWLVLPIIGMIFSAGRAVYALFSGGYFKNSVWHAYDGTASRFSFNALLAAELVVNGVIFSLSIFCLILTYKRRDILIKYIKVLYIGSAVVLFADSLCVSILFPSVEFDYKGVVRGIISVCIWVPYFSRSIRVRETFIVPYPATDLQELLVYIDEVSAVQDESVS